MRMMERRDLWNDAQIMDEESKGCAGYNHHKAMITRTWLIIAVNAWMTQFGSDSVT